MPWLTRSPLSEDSITVDGKTIKIYAEKDAKDLPWGEIGVDVVLECTGFYTSKAKSQAHIDAGAKKVVISAPAGNDLKTIVYSVNEKTLTAEDQIISAASCTTNCLAPMADALNKYAPIQSGIMTTVHALHRRPDGSGRPPSQGRPAPCSRCRCEHRSQLHRRCQGHRPGHPRAERQADRLRPARACSHRLHHHPGGCCQGQGHHQGRHQRRYEGCLPLSPSATPRSRWCPPTSSASRYGSLFDATQTMVAKIDDDTYQVQVVSWYDNENSYTSQMVRTIKYFAEI